MLARAEDDGSSSAVVDLYDLPASKRPYFISPRVGRSYWNSNKESSEAKGEAILFLLANPDQAHRIGTRSSTKLGYVPQARIGRRAQPTGLMPMPRVGRSDPTMPADILQEHVLNQMNLADDAMSLN